MVVRRTPKVPGLSMYEKIWYFERQPRRAMSSAAPRAAELSSRQLLRPATALRSERPFRIHHPGAGGLSSGVGNDIICVATALIELRVVGVCDPVTTLMPEAPSGLVEVEAEVQNGDAGGGPLPLAREIAARLQRTDSKVISPRSWMRDRRRPNQAGMRRNSPQAPGGASAVQVRSGRGADLSQAGTLSPRRMSIVYRRAEDSVILLGSQGGR